LRYDKYLILLTFSQQCTSLYNGTELALGFRFLSAVEAKALSNKPRINQPTIKQTNKPANQSVL
jgi:hypothetical protein